VLTCCFVWLRNLVCQSKGRIQIVSVENRVLRGIFGPKGEEMAGGWRRLRNGKLHNL